MDVDVHKVSKSTTAITPINHTNMNMQRVSRRRNKNNDSFIVSRNVRLIDDIATALLANRHNDTNTGLALIGTHDSSFINGKQPLKLCQITDPHIGMYCICLYECFL